MYPLLIYIPLIFLLVTIQTAVVRLFPDVLYQPDLLALAIIYFAPKKGRIVGQSLGFFGGLLEDITSLAPFGFHIIMRTALGYIMGFYLHWKVDESLATSVLLVVIGYLTNIIIAGILGILTSYTSIISSILSINSIWECLLTILFSPFLFALFSLLVFNKKSSFQEQ